MGFEVFTFLSGVPYNRGRFDSIEATKALQSELHQQGWYYVPILSGQEAVQHNMAATLFNRASAERSATGKELPILGNQLPLGNIDNQKTPSGHAPNCGWHLDQYDFECDCGLIPICPDCGKPNCDINH